MSSDQQTLCVRFNQDCSCISVGTKQGYKIYTCDPFVKRFSDNNGGIAVVEMLYRSSLVALVGAGEQPSNSPRRLQILNTTTKKSLCELPFGSTVLAVRLNKKRLVVVLETKTFIYELDTTELLYTIETEPNPRGICAMATESGESCLALPARATVGDVTVWDTISITPLNRIHAHATPIAALALSHDASLLATASHKGTVIRVFRVRCGSKAHTFRRGTLASHVYCIAFSRDAHLLAVSAASGTIHIFNLAHPQSSEGIITSLVPALSDLLDPPRCFAFIRLRCAAYPNVCAFPTNHHVRVATWEGLVSEYLVDDAAGGECRLVNENTTLDSAPDHINARFV